MISEELKKAREFEEEQSAHITGEDRPVYHFTPWTGWLNDPNGFSYYGGKYHLFYQYNPFDPVWGLMYWGHAVSSDLLNWKYLPAAMAPDTDYDRGGCYSGSAITMPDGKHMLMYTGCTEDKNDELGRCEQRQCIAIGDGLDYDKYEGNPVIAEADLPDGAEIHEFRDPYIWSNGLGRYRAVAANANNNNGGTTQICLYKSDDGLHWRREGTLFEDSLRTGIMWECPNFFNIGKYYVLMACPMNMEEEQEEGTVRFPKGNNECYMIGTFDDETGQFTPETTNDFNPSYHPVDYGLDFYAAHVLNNPDGRKIMIAWMQNPGTSSEHAAEKQICGQMTVPRELFIKQEKLCQRPVREVRKLRSGKVEYKNVKLSGNDIKLDKVNGRVADLIIRLRPDKTNNEAEAQELPFNSFSVRFAKKGDLYTELSFDPHKSVLVIDRGNSVKREMPVSSRAVKIRNRNGALDLRILLDKWSAEVFVNDGEEVITTTFDTDTDAEDIEFSCAGTAVMNLTKYDLTTK